MPVNNLINTSSTQNINLNATIPSNSGISGSDSGTKLIFNSTSNNTKTDELVSSNVITLERGWNDIKTDGKNYKCEGDGISFVNLDNANKVSITNTGPGDVIVVGKTDNSIFTNEKGGSFDTHNCIATNSKFFNKDNGPFHAGTDQDQIVENSDGGEVDHKPPTNYDWNMNLTPIKPPSNLGPDGEFQKYPDFTKGDKWDLNSKKRVVEQDGKNYLELNLDWKKDNKVYDFLHNKDGLRSSKTGMDFSEAALEAMYPQARENGGVPDEVIDKQNPAYPHISDAMDFLDLKKVTPQMNLAWLLFLGQMDQSANKDIAKFDALSEGSALGVANYNPKAIKDQLKEIYYKDNLGKLELS